MVEAKRPAVDDVDAPAAKRPSGGSGALEEDLEAELDAEQDQQAEEDVDTIMFDDDIELHLGEAGRNWTRPEPKPHDPRKDKLGMFAEVFWLSYILLPPSDIACFSFGLAYGASCSFPADGGGLHNWPPQQGRSQY